MSNCDLYGRDSRAIRAAKALRRERLRPIRQVLADLPGRIRMHGGDSEKVWFDAGFPALEIDLRKPLDEAALHAVCDYLHERLDHEQDYLDERRARVEAFEDAIPTPPLCGVPEEDE